MRRVHALDGNVFRSTVNVAIGDKILDGIYNLFKDFTSD
jgi:hypothetical protein